MQKEILRLEHINIELDRIPILKDFSLNVFEGEVICVLSNDREEKSALAKSLAGLSEIDSGIIYFNDKPVNIRNRINSMQLGIFLASNNVSHNLTVEENFFLSSSPRRPFYCKNSNVRNTQLCLDNLGLKIRASELVSRLSMLERRLMEIANAYYCNARLVILNDVYEEPMSSPAYYTQFHNIIKIFKKQGISFLILTSNSNDATVFSDRITLLKNGTNIKTYEKTEFKYENLCSIMLGTQFRGNQRYNHISDKSESILIENILPFKNQKLCISSFRREILGIIDYESEIINSLSKLVSLTPLKSNITGRIASNPFSFNTLRGALKQGIGFIFGGSYHNQIFNNMDIFSNISIQLNERTKKMGLFISTKKLKIIMDDYKVNDLYKNHSYVFNKSKLSIMDRHKILLSRWLVFNPKILICINPYYHFDPDLILLVNSFFDQIAAQGTTIIIIHNYLPIVTPIYDRILFIHKGKLNFEISKDEIKDPYFLINKLKAESDLLDSIRFSNF